MADSSAPPPAPGSRAIKIPVLSSKNTDYAAPTRRRRSLRYMKNNAERAEASDAGPSSLGSGSEVDSTWSYSPGPNGRSQDRLQTVASPSTQNAQFPTPSSNGTNNPSQRKDKHKANTLSSSAVPPPSTMPNLFVHTASSPLGPSMLSSSSYKSINLNTYSSSHDVDPDSPPRLITYTKHSQGFTWNDELFLPSYMLGRYGERGRKKQYDADFGDEEDHCPVAEIFVTDEEAEAMMP